MFDGMNIGCPAYRTLTYNSSMLYHPYKIWDHNIQTFSIKRQSYNDPAYIIW